MIFNYFKNFREKHNDLLVLFLQRGWQGFAGILTVGLAVYFLNPAQLGAYYSFLSIAGTSTLVDFGLSTVLLQQSARNFADAGWEKDGTIKGETQDQQLALISQSTIWYRWIAIFFFISSLTFGWGFFKDVQVMHELEWRLPWLCLCTLVSLSLFLNPYFSFIEGSGRIVEAYQVRLIQGILGSILCWILLVSGGELYALIATPLFICIIGWIWLWKKYPNLIFLPNRALHLISWRKSIWPFQWRIGVGLVCAYAQVQLISPILLKTQGPVLAGKVGVSLTIINMVAIISQSSLIRKVPELARQAVQGQKKMMDKVFFSSLGLVIALYIFGIFIFLALVIFLPEKWLMSKILPISEIILLAIAVLFNICAGGFTLYIRSFNKEPFVVLTILSSLMIITLGYYSSIDYSVKGYLIVLSLINVFIVFPISLFGWLKYRRINFLH